MAQVVSTIVEVCIFRINRDRAEFLLLRRAGRQTVYPGLWQFVTGKIKQGEDGATAARREVREETGFSNGMLWTVPFVLSFYDPGTDTVNMNPLFAFRPEGEAVVQISEEHDRFEWVTDDQALKRLVWPDQREGLETVRRFIVEGGEAGRLTLISPQSRS